MKNPVLLTILFALFLLSSCADKPARPDALLSEAQKVAADAAADAAAVGGIQSAPAGVAGLAHYYCANSCEGSGGDAQANCPTCGTAYTHNAAFHNQTAPTAAPATTINSPNIVNGDGSAFTTAISPPASTTPPAPSPAQNANGVFHYTCAQGCAGGAGAAAACGSCGEALAHNADYHN